MNKCLISIIVPIYKIDKYLGSCIDSILSQTYTHFELILVDDGSPDNSPYICDEYAKKDPRIVVIHKQNGGQSSARNVGLEVAKGEYISFVDGDDVLEPRFLEKHIQALTMYKCEMSVCFSKSFDSDNDLKAEPPISNKVLCIDCDSYWTGHILNDVDFVVPWNKLYKKELLRGLRFPEGKTQEDEYFIHHVVFRCKSICIISEKLYFYRQRPGSTMTNGMNYYNYCIFLIDRLIFFCGLKKYHYAADAMDYFYNSFFKVKRDNKDVKQIKVAFKNAIKKTGIRKFHIKTKIKIIIFSFSPKIFQLIFIKRNKK